MELSQQTLLRISLTLQRHKMNSLRRKIQFIIPEVPTVNLDSEQLLQTQGSYTPSVNAASNTRKNTPKSSVKYFRKKKIYQERFKTPPVPPLALSLPNSIQEELIRDDFIYVPPQNETQQTSNNDCPQESEKQGSMVSLTSSVIEDLIKDDYFYDFSDEVYDNNSRLLLNCFLFNAIALPKNNSNNPKNLQWHGNQNKKHLLIRPLEQQQLPCEEPTAQQSEQEAPVDVCPLELEKQGVTFFKDDYVYEVSDEEQQQQSQEPPVARQSEQETLILSSFDSVAQPRQRENERPFFSLGIMVDAGVAAALKFAKATTSEPTLPTAEVFKNPEKKIKISKELIEKCYH
ncbi:hypothetical protein Ahy_A06g026098 isoform A [Arachis hypogaea]|uniref:Uncharacterized protein n=1 Tax=Arachis hypogaea TaxID=3818 RepID=A0A445CJD4_ARAHY|nr:hypothetical protein Ahy_A06g026098 isoform A [Arachis hypogaea]